MEDIAAQPQATSKTEDSARAFVLGARAALAFLTRIPCGSVGGHAAGLRWASAWFPVVGFVLGFLSSLVWVGLSKAGGTVAAVATVAVLALVTGAFHEDGLADTADALGGAYDRKKLFAILKDSRIGSFGATALMLVLALRIACLARLGPGAVGGLVLAETASRVFPVWLMTALPYVSATDTSRSKPVVHARMAHALIATSFTGLAALLLLAGHLLAWRPLVTGLLLAAVATLLCGWRFRVRAGGITGDFLGATQQIVNALILLGLVLGA
jgi:adenosylcobinamide-GDP ribazoletransferase